jgi:hypothetical protein
MGLVLFGGEGSAEIVRIAQALNRAESRVQLILLCGKNAEVISQLRAMDRRIPMWIEGFTREVPFYMELSDFFIGKPGRAASARRWSSTCRSWCNEIPGPWRMTGTTRIGSRSSRSAW